MKFFFFKKLYYNFCNLIYIKKESNTFFFIKATLETESILRGLPRKLPKKKDRERESRIQVIYNDRDNRPVLDFLRGIAHNLSL
jgi:hypothetical protein